MACKGANPYTVEHINGNSALHSLVIDEHHSEIFFSTQLLRSIIQILKTKENPLHPLIDRCNYADNTPLHMAVSLHTPLMAEALIAHYPSINIPNKMGNAVYQWASKRPYSPIAKKILLYQSLIRQRSLC